MDFSICDNMVGFPKYSQILCICMYIYVHTYVLVLFTICHIRIGKLFELDNFHDCKNNQRFYF